MPFEETVSKKIKDQTELVLQYLNTVSDIIIHKKLVPVSEDEILSFTSKMGKALPLDFSYWLMTQGSGFIDFINESLTIPSLHDLYNLEDGRLNSEHPDQSWKRISLVYSGAPSIDAMDTTIIDEDGCCPIITTYEYEDRVCEVMASSWPMFLLRNIIGATKKIFPRIQDNASIQDLTDSYFPGIDKDLEKAHTRAMKHNRTKVDKDEIKKVMSDDLSSCIEGHAGDASKEKIKDLDNAIRVLNDCYEKGNLYAYDASSYIEDKTVYNDLPVLYKLLEHPIRETRGNAFSAIKRLLNNLNDVSLKVPPQVIKVKNKTRDIKLATEIEYWEQGLKRDK